MDEFLKEATLIECSKLLNDGECPMRLSTGKHLDLCNEVRLYCEDAIDRAVNKLSEEGPG